MDLTELNVKFDSNDEQLMLDIINYILITNKSNNGSANGLVNGYQSLVSIGLLRSGLEMIEIISLYEKQTKWQSSQVIDLFFKYKNEVINEYNFINGWIDTYYHCGYDIVGDDLRFANNREVMIIALLVLNVLYMKRQSLNYDLRIRLEAVWIDFNSMVDSVLMWIRTRAQLIQSDNSVRSCAHQLFSGHSLFEYQSIQQRLSSLVQQNLINEQMKKLESKEVFIEKQNKELTELGTKMLEMMIELKEVRKANEILSEEVKWQKGINNELNDKVRDLKHENYALKQLALNQNAIQSDTCVSPQLSVINDETTVVISDGTHGTHDTRDAEDTEPKLLPDLFSEELESNCQLILTESSEETDSNLNVLDIDSSLHSINGSSIDKNSGLNIDCNTIGLTEKLDDTDCSTEAEDITDSGNHSDAAADDILVEINESCLQSECNNKDSDNEKVFKFNSWQEFFANDSNNDHDLENGQQIDTYNKSNQCMGTNDKRIYINHI